MPYRELLPFVAWQLLEEFALPAGALWDHREGREAFYQRPCALSPARTAPAQRAFLGKAQLGPTPSGVSAGGGAHVGHAHDPAAQTVLGAEVQPRRQVPVPLLARPG